MKASGRDPRTTERVVAVDLATGPTDKILKKLRRVVAGGYAKGRFNRRDPRVIEAAEKMLSDQEILDHIYRYNTSAQVIETVEKFRKAGATQVSICEIGEDPEKAMRVYSAGDPAL